MVVVFHILKLHDVWLWSYSTAKYGKFKQVQVNIFAVLRHWIPGSTNRHAITMVEKANCNEKKSRFCVFNDYNNNGGES